MATIYWLGTADAVKQVATVQITAFDAATTYEITIGDKVVSVIGNTNVNTTASDLQVALEASTNPYFVEIDWTVSTDTITATAGTAGVPFVAASSVTGGTGTIGAVTTTTTSSGPNDWSTALNWSGGAVPVNSDTVHFRDNSISVAYGLDQNAVTLTLLNIDKTYTGKIGLDYRRFATSVDGATTDATEVEYRDVYLKISSTDITIGKTFGSGSPSGSSRILIDTGTNVTQVEVFDTSNSSSETGRQAVRLKGVNSSNVLFVREAPGGVGIAAEVPGEVSTYSKISISDQTTTTRVQCGEGLTLTTFEQFGGDNILNATATVTTVLMCGGILTTEGINYTITTITIRGGTVNCNHKSSGDAITTVNIINGTLNGTQTSESRTWNTVNLNVGGTLINDSNVITITTLNHPTNGLYTIATT